MQEVLFSLFDQYFHVYRHRFNKKIIKLKKQIEN